MARMAVLSKRKRVAVVVTATCFAAAAALTWLHLATPERVTPSSEEAEYQPPRVAANAPAASAPASTDYGTVADITEQLIHEFSGDLSFARSTEQATESFAYGEPDACLVEWASANLAGLAETGVYEVMTVCGRPTLVLAGPDGADSKVLVRAALEETAPAGARQIIAESVHDRMAFAAVRSEDGKAQLLATAELPD